MRLPVIVLLCLSLCATPILAMQNLNGDPVTYPSPSESGAQLLLNEAGTTGSFSRINASGVITAWGTASYTAVSGIPTENLYMQDNSGNSLVTTMRETDLGDRFRYDYATSLDSTNFNVYYIVMKSGASWDMTQDPENYMLLTQFNTALQGKVKLWKAFKDLNQYCLTNNQGRLEMNAAACVAVSTAGLVIAAAGCASLWGCLVGVAFADACIGLCAA